MGIARQRRRSRLCTGRGERVEWALEPADTAAVYRLRHQIMSTLRRIADPGADLGATEIVVAELLSNALAHTTGQAWVSLRWDGTHPLLSVADVGPGFPMAAAVTGLIDTSRTLTPRLPDDPLAEGGRGLYLVAHLALDVAVAARSTGGTVVSVTLDLKRAS
jgi:anti-sigma regulatory factor (Ser/Thr protein kinase)